MFLVCLYAKDIKIKGEFKKGSAISITQIINHETNEKKLLQRVELPDGKLNIILKVSETCQLELFGNNGNQSLGTTYIYVENGGVYTLTVDESGAKGFTVIAEEFSNINRLYRSVEKEYFELAQQFSPDFQYVEFWQEKIAMTLKKHHVEKDSYLGKLITYLYANTELSIPMKFALKSNNIEKAKQILTTFETKYYSGRKLNIPTYYMTLSSLNRLKNKVQ